MKNIIFLLLVCLVFSCAKSTHQQYPVEFAFPTINCQKNTRAIDDYKKVAVDLITTSQKGMGSEAVTLAVIRAFSNQGFNIVDRTNLRRILAEQKLSGSGITKGRSRAGQLSDVDAIVQGDVRSYTFSDRTNHVRLLMKITDRETGEMTNSCSGDWRILGSTEQIAESLTYLMIKTIRSQ